MLDKLSCFRFAYEGITDEGITDEGITDEGITNIVALYKIAG